MIAELCANEFGFLHGNCSFGLACDRRGGLTTLMTFQILTRTGPLCASHPLCLGISRHSQDVRIILVGDTVRILGLEEGAS